MFVIPLLGLRATGDFLNEFHMYEDLRDLNTLKAFMETQLDDYNQTPGLVPMSLVLFRDAFEHSASRTQHTARTLAADGAPQVFRLTQNISPVFWGWGVCFTVFEI